MIAPDTLCWSASLDDLLAQTRPNALKPKKRTGTLGLLLGQVKSPIILILFAAATLSLFLYDPADAVIILSEVW